MHMHACLYTHISHKLGKGFRRWIIIYCHDTLKIHHHGVWLVSPSPHTPLALHHLVDWLIVFCHRHCNAFFCDYPDVGDTVIYMAVTASTDGAVIVSTRWWSTCFVVRFLVSSCGRSPFDVFRLFSESTASHAEWSFVAAREIGGHLFRHRTESLSGDELAQKGLQSYLFLLNSTEDTRFPLSHPHRDFLSPNDWNIVCALTAHLSLFGNTNMLDLNSAVFVIFIITGIHLEYNVLDYNQCYICFTDCETGSISFLLLLLF